MLDALPDISVLRNALIAPPWAGGEVSRHATQTAQTLSNACPGARILPVPILDSNGQSGDIRAMSQAFTWLAENAERFGINLICAPISDGTNSIDDSELRESELGVAISNLRQRGVLTVAAAGNGFRYGSRAFCQGMGTPAILRETISVGAANGSEPAPRSQRLALSGPCRTTCFAHPAPPGGTSGAAARVSSMIAARMIKGESGEVALAELLHGSAETVVGGPEEIWPALLD
ncbi:S8 family serine peptidase [Thalassococcus sp. S3]|uniref:S8 family serine peptidase n=1 Tax=Thalassococcus sp. S3 TaxID=2017482 RepID=UPI0013EE81AE|nr:S8 family serine peptidase [Thalassococcus sp. S3]